MTHPLPATNRIQHDPAAPAAPGRERRRFYELDLLRFLAALAVVFYHFAFRGYAEGHYVAMPNGPLAPAAKYGCFGVQLFFMISGFVILMSARGGSARRFAVSRIVRLYPAFWVCCTLTFLAVYCLGPGGHPSWRNYLVNMTLFHRLFGADPIDTVYWTLVVEMKFYFLVLLVLLFRQIERTQLLLWLWLALAALQHGVNIPYIDRLVFHDFAPYFIAGSAFYLLHLEGVSLAKLALILGAFILALLGLRPFVAQQTSLFHIPFSLTLVRILITLCFVLFFLIATNVTAPLGRRAWVAIGALTYPLYLVHQRTGYLLINLLYPHLPPLLIIFGLAVLFTALAWAIHRYVEKPLAPRLKTALDRLLRLPPRI